MYLLGGSDQNGEVFFSDPAFPARTRCSFKASGVAEMWDAWAGLGRILTAHLCRVWKDEIGASVTSWAREASLLAGIAHTAAPFTLSTVAIAGLRLSTHSLIRSGL